MLVRGEVACSAILCNSRSESKRFPLDWESRSCFFCSLDSANRGDISFLFLSAWFLFLLSTHNSRWCRVSDLEGSWVGAGNARRSTLPLDEISSPVELLIG